MGPVSIAAVGSTKNKAQWDLLDLNWSTRGVGRFLSIAGVACGILHRCIIHIHISNTDIVLPMCAIAVQRSEPLRIQFCATGVNDRQRISPKVSFSDIAINFCEHANPHSSLGVCEENDSTQPPLPTNCMLYTLQWLSYC